MFLYRGFLYIGVFLYRGFLYTGVFLYRGGLDTGVLLYRVDLYTGVLLYKGGLYTGVLLYRGGLYTGVLLYRGGLYTGVLLYRVDLYPGMLLYRGGLYRSGEAPIYKLRKPTFWFPNKSNTNQAVELQKMAKGLKFRIRKLERLYYQKSEIKGANQLRGYHKADLYLCFRICKTLVF